MSILGAVLCFPPKLHHHKVTLRVWASSELFYCFAPINFRTHQQNSSAVFCEPRKESVLHVCTPERCFYDLKDSRYFPFLVGLINTQELRKSRREVVQDTFLTKEISHEMCLTCTRVTIKIKNVRATSSEFLVDDDTSDDKNQGLCDNRQRRRH